MVSTKLIPTRMPDSTQAPEARPEHPSNTKAGEPATSSPPKASPAHEDATSETSQIPVFNANLLENPVTIPQSTILNLPRPIKTVDCNMMQYTNGDGVARQIYMPKGTAALASNLLTAKRFSDLAKFPAWGELSSKSSLRRRLRCPSPRLPSCVDGYVYLHTSLLFAFLMSNFTPSCSQPLDNVYVGS